MQEPRGNINMGISGTLSGKPSPDDSYALYSIKTDINISIQKFGKNVTDISVKNWDFYLYQQQLNIYNEQIGIFMTK